jgi:hypothetical protein
MTRITHASLDRLLTDALRGDAAAAPVPEGLLRVPDRLVRGRRLASSSGPVLAVGGVMTLAVVATLAVLAVVGALGERGPSIGSDDVPPDAAAPIEALDVEPRPGQVPEMGEPAIGPVIEVARGRADGKAFAYTVYRGALPSDVCIQFQWGPSGAGACGAMPGEGPAGGAFGVGSMSHGSAVVHEVFGLVAPNVAEVSIQTDAGEIARTQLVPVSGADVDALLFFAFLPGGVDSSAWIALDSAGNEIDRFETPPGPPGQRGPVPTPDQAPAP